MKVAQITRKNGWPIRYTIAGIDHDQTMNQLIHESKNQEVVKYIGHTNEPGKFLAQHHVFLLTSRYEGTPNALLEAMSRGMPVVTTAVGDLTSIFTNDEHAKICEIGDAESIACQLYDIYCNWDKALEMANRGREKVLQEFSIDAARKRLYEIFEYHNLLEN